MKKLGKMFCLNTYLGKKMEKISTFKNSLGYRLAWYILIFSAVVTIISTGLELVFEYNRDIESINKTADQIKITHLNSLIQNIWAHDTLLIEKELEGLASLPDISYVSIISKDKAIFSIGESLADQHLLYEYPLYYKHREKDINLGTLHIEVSLNGVYQRLLDRVIIIFFSQALKTFLVSSFVFVIFHYLIGQHLKTMATFARSFNLQCLDKPLVLEREKFSGNENDELSLVESAINTMRSNLIKELEAVQLAQNALLESEERFRSLVSNIPGIVYRYNAPSPCEIIHISETAETITGYQVKDFLDGKINFGQLVHFNDSLRVSKEVKASVDEGRFFEIEYKIIDKNKKTKWMFEKGKAVYDLNNKPLWIDGVILDVSEKKIAEQQLNEKNHLLSAIIENTTDAIFLKNTERKYILANAATFKAIGKEENEVLNKTDYELFPKSSADVINKIDSSVFDFKKSIIAEERIHTSSGDTYWQTNKTPFLDTEGNLIGMVGISRNITELKLAQKDKEELEKRLLQAQKMEAIGTLAGGIAHDFNNILGAILGYAEIARDSIPPGSTSIKYLDKVMEAGHRAAGLVKQILAFSRQSDVENVSIQPAVIIQEIIKILRSTLPSTITIKQQIDRTTKLIFADPTQVHQILMNLCTNAFHAMEQSGGVLEIALKNRELSQDELESQSDVHPGSFVELSIKDSGTGIPLEIRDKIFEPYFTTKEIGKGTGMGLAIVHGLIKKYGGFVTCESNPGQGTIFQVYFPAVDKEDKSPIKTLETIPRGSERVLLIDDEDLLVDLGKTMLEHLGYEVTVRTNSLDALTTFQNQPDSFDVVITDQTMPGMTGSDLASRMLQIRPDLPIILCTGFSNLISEEKAMSLGIKGYAMKPLAKKDIAALIRKVLDEKNSL